MLFAHFFVVHFTQFSIKNFVKKIIKILAFCVFILYNVRKVVESGGLNH